MPHKRAKRSVRLQKQQEIGFDLPPTAPKPTAPPPPTKRGSDASDGGERSNKRRKKTNDLPTREYDSFGGRADMHGMSKTAWRVLNAQKLRDEYNAQRRRGHDTTTEEQGKTPVKTDKKQKDASAKLEIMPHEKLSDFNRRVEATLRSDVNAAVRKSKGAEKKKRQKQKQAQEEPEQQQQPVVVKEFEPISYARPLSETIQAPPTLQRGSRKLENVNKVNEKVPSHRLPIGDAMKEALERERQKAIETYRALKEQRLAQRQQQQT